MKIIYVIIATAFVNNEWDSSWITKRENFGSKEACEERLIQKWNNKELMPGLENLTRVSIEKDWRVKLTFSDPLRNEKVLQTCAYLQVK